MLKRHGFFILALGLILAPLLGQAQQQDEDAQGAPTEQQDSPQILPLPLPVEIIESDAAADARQREEHEAEERQIRDLAAQEGVNVATQAMNDATQRMAQYAFWSTVIVGVGTVLLFWTLWETRKANRSTREAVDVTRDVGQAQVRAYLYCKSARYRLSKDALTAEIEIANAGQSPATNVVVHAELTCYSVVGLVGHSRVLCWAKSSTQIISVEPVISGGSKATSVTFFDKIHFNTEDHNETPLLDLKDANEVGLDLVIAWNDVFGIRHRFDVMMNAGIDAGPNFPRKKRTPTGTFGFTMSDPEKVAEGKKA